MAITTTYDIVNGNRADDRDTITTYVFSPTATLKTFSLGGNSDGDTIAIDALSSDFKVKVKKDTMTLIGLKNTPSAGVVIKIQLDNIDAAGGTSSLAFLDGTVDVSFVPSAAGAMKGSWTFGGIKVGKTLNLSNSNISYTIDGDNTYSDLDIAAQRELNGQTFTLTTSVDAIPGMVGSKGTTSTLGHDTILAVATGDTKTLNFGDQIDGGEGSDLMRIVTDQVEVSLAGKQISNVEDLLVEVYPSEDDELEGNYLDLDTLNVNNVAFDTVTVDFNDGIELDGSGEDSGIININKESAVTIQNLDIDDNELTLGYAGAGAINNSLTLNNISNGEIEIDFNHPDNGLDEEDDAYIADIAGGTYTINMDTVDDLQIDLDENVGDEEDGGGAATLNLNIKGDSTGIQIDNSEGFAEDQDATVNIRLDANLEGEDWYLADIGGEDSTGELTINISGSGNLTIDDIESDGDTLVKAGSATGDIDIDFDNNDDVVSVITGSGDDRIVLEDDYFDGDADDSEEGVIVDMKTGRNTLGVSGYWGYDWWYDEDLGDERLSALDFTDAVITGAQILEIHGSDVSMDDDATLNMAGLSQVDTLKFDESFYGNDYVLSLRFAKAIDGNGIDEVETVGFPTSFNIEADGEIDNAILDTGLIQNLTITAGEDVDIEGIESEALKTLNVSGDDVWIDLYSDQDNLSALTTITVNAADEASVELVGSQTEIAPEAVDEYVEFDIVGGFNGGGNNATWSVELDFEGSNHDVVVEGTGKISAGDLQVALQDAIRQEFGQYGLTNDRIVLSGSGNSRTITVNWPTTINGPDLLAVNVDSSANVNEPTITITEAGEDDDFDFDGDTPGDGDGDGGGDVLYVGDGFNALADVNVVAGDDADVYIEDAYGQFDVTVSAGNEDNEGADADVYIFDANVGAVTIDAADNANLVLSNVAGVSSINVTGDSIDLYNYWDWATGIQNVTMTGAGTVTLTAVDYVYAEFDEVTGMKTLTIVSGDDDGDEVSTDNYIYLEDTISLTTIDLTGVTDNELDDEENAFIYVDANNAAFGSAVSIRFGNSDAYYENDTSADIKETFVFTSDFGTITIDDFDLALDADGDKIDLSVFTGINGIGDLSFTDDGDNVAITAAGTEFTGTIYLIGVNEADLTAGNFVF